MEKKMFWVDKALVDKKLLNKSLGILISCQQQKNVVENKVNSFFYYNFF